MEMNLNSYEFSDLPLEEFFFLCDCDLGRVRHIHSREKLLSWIEPPTCDRCGKVIIIFPRMQAFWSNIFLGEIEFDPITETYTASTSAEVDSVFYNAFEQQLHLLDYCPLEEVCGFHSPEAAADYLRSLHFFSDSVRRTMLNPSNTNINGRDSTCYSTEGKLPNRAQFNLANLLNPIDIIHATVELRIQLSKLEKQIQALQPAFFAACVALNTEKIILERAVITQKLTPGRWTYSPDILQQEDILKLLKRQFQQDHEPTSGRNLIWIIKLLLAQSA